MAIEKTLLGNLIPNSTEPSEICQGENDVSIEVVSVVVCNVSASDQRFSIYVRHNSDEWATSSAHYYSCPINGYQTVEISSRWFLTPASSIAVAPSTAATIAFHVYGVKTS